VGAVVAHTWLHLYPVPAGMRAVPLVRPDVRQSIGLVWPDHRAEPLLTPALISTVREVDLGRSPGAERRVRRVACTVMRRLVRVGGG
jgi:hypothetical protein